MTDTARTLSAIKELLADNTTGQISPQDVRDAIESIANPIAGGGFDRPVNVLLADWTLAVASGSGAAVSAKLGATAPNTPVFDAGIGSDGDYLTLPFAGTYLISASLSWNSNAGTSRYIYFDCLGSSGSYNPEQFAPAPAYNVTFTAMVHYAGTAKFDLIGTQHGGGSLTIAGAWLFIIGWPS